jgi:phosphonate transport system substrate-binding protein
MAGSPGEGGRSTIALISSKAALCLLLAGGGLLAVAGMGALLEVRTPLLDFSEREHRPWNAEGGQESDGKLRFAVATMVSAEATFSTYQRLVRKIAELVGRKPAFVLRPSYADVRRSMAGGDIDVAFVCTGTYVHAHSTGTIKLLVQPQFEQGLTYRSLLIVPAQSAAGDLEDLHGAVMAFTDPESNTGRLVPTVEMVRRGLDPQAHFKRIVYTGSHDLSIQAVGLRLVEAAAVDSLIYESVKSKDPTVAGEVKVIWESEAFGPPPVVVRRGLDARLEASLRTAFLGLDEDPEGRDILSAIGIQRFVPAREEDYRSALRLRRWLLAQEDQ